MENKEFSFETLWQAQKIQKPDFQALQEKIKHYKKENLKKQLFANISLISTLLFLIVLWVLLDELDLTTKVGLCLVILAVSLSLLKFNRFYSLFGKFNDNKCGNSEIDTSQQYLKKLMEINQQQKRLQSDFMKVYFLLLGFGFTFYMYEFAQKMSLWMACLVYGLTFLWFGFVWFYLKPRIIRKQQQKLDDLIRAIENKAQHFSE